MAPMEDARWWEVESPPQGPSEVNKYVDRCLEFLLTQQPDAPACRIVAHSLREAWDAATACDNCGLSVGRVARVRNPFCTAHTFGLCPACRPIRLIRSS